MQNFARARLTPEYIEAGREERITAKITAAKCSWSKISESGGVVQRENARCMTMSPPGSASLNRCSASHQRVDRKGSVHQLQSFPHAGQTQPPKSRTVSSISSGPPVNDTWKSREPLCLIPFCKDSWSTRKRHKDTSCDKSLGTSWE